MVRFPEIRIIIWDEIPITFSSEMLYGSEHLCQGHIGDNKVVEGTGAYIVNE